MKAIFNLRSSSELTDLQSDDPVAFGRFVTAHQDMVFGFLGRMGFAQEDAEDLAQETFLRVWRNRQSYEPGRAKISTWLCTIARNVALTEIDKRTRRPYSTKTDTDTLATDEPGPDQKFDSSATTDQLNAALIQLPIEDRSAIALHYVDGLSARDAAQVTGCHTGTYRTRLSRARKKLQTIWYSQSNSGNEIS